MIPGGLRHADEHTKINMTRTTKRRTLQDQGDMGGDGHGLACQHSSGRAKGYLYNTRIWFRLAIHFYGNELESIHVQNPILPNAVANIMQVR